MSVWCDYRCLPQGIGHVCELHCHAYYEVTVLLSGKIELFNGAHRSSHTGPCLLVEKPFALHNLTVKPGENYERYNLYFSAGALNDLYSLSDDSHEFFTSDLTIFPLDQTVCEQLVFYLRRIQQMEKRQTLCSSLLHVFLNEICIYAQGHPVLRYSTANRTMSLVLQYIDAHLEEELCLVSLAEHFHVGVTKLCEDFKKYSLYTVAQYIRFARIERAKQYLQNGMTVLETAMRCGFSNECHFITVFRQAMHCTPGQYARNCRTFHKNINGE